MGKTYDFKFSKSNWFFSVSLGQFKKTAERLESVVNNNSSGSPFKSDIAASENGLTYAIQTPHYMHDFNDKVLEERPTYHLGELDVEKWDQAKYLMFRLRPVDSKERSWINLNFDKEGNSGKLSFQGCGLDKETSDAVVCIFRDL